MRLIFIVRILIVALFLLQGFGSGLRIPAQEPHSLSALTPQQWQGVENAVDGALNWLAGQQREDGSFPTVDVGQPAVTALCVMAFLSRGHLPGEGTFGQVIDHGIDFVLKCRRPDGLITLTSPGPAMETGNTPAHTAVYNHAISGLLLSEVYGMTDRRKGERIRPILEEALLYSRARQAAPKRHACDRGGWRYVRPWEESDSDLSVTGWQLMFYRSAKNAGFEVPSEYVDEAMEYVQRCFNPEEGTFRYKLVGVNLHTGRAMAGAGILSLSLGGLHDHPMARTAGDWVLRHPFDAYNVGTTSMDRFHYGAYYCSQAMYQLGGKYWEEFFPVLVETLVNNQNPDGSWKPEAISNDTIYGNAYTTALSVLALCTPYQLLPIYQR